MMTDMLITKFCRNMAPIKGLKIKLSALCMERITVSGAKLLT